MSKTAAIYFWAGATKTLEEKAGYEHNSEIPYEEVFKIAEEISDKGLNVMVLNTQEGRLLAIDTMRFQQR